jgi:sugar lactone lactonase YvrE
VTYPTLQAHVVVACGNILGETATWSERERALYWVDIRAPALHRFDPARGEHRQWPMPELCCAVVPMPNGVLLAFPRHLAQFDPISGEFVKLCEIEPESLNNRLNEAKCDLEGRLWVGSMRDFGAATTGSLYRVWPDLRVDRVLTDITVPNSLGWSPDGQTMYFADTPTRILRAYAFDPESGDIGATRALLPADALPGRPDGCTVDAEGHVWSARIGAGCVARISPEGEIAAIVEVDASQPASCALGGPGLRTLFITTAKQKLDAEQLRIQPHAGDLFAVEVDVPGMPDVEFATSMVSAGAVA